MSYGGAGSGGGQRVRPCGACKFLKRKCVKGCIFAPYFDSDQGTSHFAAVHKMFGARNASKLLLRIPPQCRLDAVFTLCYEALARVKDPVYGCVGHIFTLQQQVVNLQEELANTQARISTLASPSSPPPPVLSSSSLQCSSELAFPKMASPVSFFNSVDQELDDDGDLQYLARDYVSIYFTGVRFKPPSPQ